MTALLKAEDDANQSSVSVSGHALIGSYFGMCGAWKSRKFRCTATRLERTDDRHGSAGTVRFALSAWQVLLSHADRSFASRVIAMTRSAKTSTWPVQYTLHEDTEAPCRVMA